MLGISAQSTQYVTTNVTASSSPLSNTVSFAFIGPYADLGAAESAVVTSETTFVTALWVGATPNYTNVYTAQCLVGPNSSNITLSPGVYQMFLKITGTPESPVLFSGPLAVS